MQPEKLLVLMMPGVVMLPYTHVHASGGCGSTYIERVSDFIRTSGSVAGSATGSTASSESPLETCDKMEGMIAILQMDLISFLQRSAAAEVLSFFKDFLSPEEQHALRTGIELCLPRKCLEELDMKPHIVIIYIACLTGDCKHSKHLEHPLPLVEYNLSFPAGHEDQKNLSALVGTSKQIVDELLEPAASGGLNDEESGGAPGVLNGTGFHVPWWYGCDGPGINSEWHGWSTRVRSAFSQGSKQPVSRSLAAQADQLVERHRSFAERLAQHAFHWAKRTCHINYLHPPDLSELDPNNFDLALYFFIGDTRMVDERWKTSAVWSMATEFCLQGYIAALYVRARALSAAGLLIQASADLHLAQDLLGSCSEFELLDVKVWGLQARDIEFNLLRMEVFNESTVGQRDHFDAIDDFTEFGSFHQIVPVKLQDSRVFAWHALQLNSLVRVRLQAAAQRAGNTVPNIGMMTFPPYLALFVVPMLSKIWGFDLKLALFYIGNWHRHEKCPECMEDYRQRFVVESSHLRDLPLKSSGGAAEAKITMHIDFEESNLQHSDLLAILRDFMEAQPKARDADMFICTAPLWFCTSLRIVAIQPILTLCLADRHLNAPPDLTDDFSRVVNSAHRLYMQQLTNPPNSPLRALLVREDLFRGYHGKDKLETSHAYPFVACMSLYINARYKCYENSNVLVMREGSLYRFAATLRGRVFYATLAQFMTKVSPWRFNILHDSKDRLTYQELANHRAAVWVQLPVVSKMTFKDLLTMEIPVFTPSSAMQMSITARMQFHGCRRAGTQGPAWAFSLCREVKYGYWANLSSLFRYPYVSHFESLTDMLLQLSDLDCSRLQAVSAKMRKWNQALIDDDAKFWRDAVLALSFWGRMPRESGIPRVLDAQDSSRPTRTTESHLEDMLSIPFKVPMGPLNWSAGAACGPLAAHCAFELTVDEAIRSSIGDATSTEYECCADAFSLEHGPFGNASHVFDPSGGCMTNPYRCDESILRHGTHLLQELPPVECK